MIWLALGIGLTSALFLGLGLFCFFRNRRLLPQYTESGEGVVTGFTAQDEEGFVRPLVRFARSGVSVTITGTVGSNPPGYKVGQKVAVRFLPGRPDTAIIADFWHLYSFEYASIAIGSVGVATAIMRVVLQCLAT